MPEYTVTFTHPKGRHAGLRARDAVEEALEAKGFAPVSAGTGFKRKGRPGRYAETTLVVVGKKPFPDSEIRKLLRGYAVARCRLSRTSGS